jgi:translation initiation factor IF-3
MRRKKRYVPHKQPQAPKREHRINQEIQALEVRLVLPDEEVNVLSINEALKVAQELGMDLVEVSPNAVPPVCKLMNYGKFQYQKAKQDRLQKSKQKKTELKSIRISLRIERHDMEVKAKKIAEFIEDGNKVKVDILLRGRENQFKDLAKSKILKFVEVIREFYPDFKEESPLETAPRGFNITLVKLK